MASLQDIIKERIKKIEGLRKLGINPYPEKTDKDHNIKNILDGFDVLVANNTKVCVAGRIMSIRGHGAILFAHIQDETGKIQFLLKQDQIGQEKMDLFEHYFDLGDFIEIKGIVFQTNTGEKTILVDNFKILCKALRPIPTEWFGLEDEEEKIRKRYLDLILDKQTKKIFDLRIDLTKWIREFLYNLDFKEVETPILQTVYGGALAEPFKTHLNALDMDLYLRIAPELYLKRLLIGGYEKIFEMAKCFRNEGIDKDHNPEFINLELYWAFASRDELMDMLEKLIIFLNNKLQEQSIWGNIQVPFPKIVFRDFIKTKTGLDCDSDSLDKFQEYLQKNNIEFEQQSSRAKLADLIFKQFRGEIKNPTFVIDQPLELSPLAKQKPDDLQHVLRFYLIMNGKEVCNGFSELNDAMEQKRRFEEQSKMLQKGDKEAHPLDLDFVEALEYGMPPAGGLGIGIDRLISVLLGVNSIKEVLFFPFVRQNPKNI